VTTLPSEDTNEYNNVGLPLLNWVACQWVWSGTIGDLPTINDKRKAIVMSNELRVIKALLRRRRVTRKTAIEMGLCENLTATISRLRKMGISIMAVRAKTPEGETYTRYKLDNTSFKLATSMANAA